MLKVLRSVEWCVVYSRVNIVVHFGVRDIDITVHLFVPQSANNVSLLQSILF